MNIECTMNRPTKPVLLVLVLLSISVTLCMAQSGDGSDDEDQLDTRTTYACENGMLILDCPQGHVIRIVRANYGRFTLSMCNPRGITSNMNLRCQSITASEVVATECDGHNRCEFKVGNRIFGDPCPGTSKYAEVKHYCEAVETDSKVKNVSHLPDAGPHLPRRPSVPVPEKIQVCLHPLSGKSIYDIYWQMPESQQTILNFYLMYRIVDEEPVELSITAINLRERKYAFTFTPDPSKQSQDHEFALKAFSLDYGWGDYSDYSLPERCHENGSGGYVTHAPPATTAEVKVLQMCHHVEMLGAQWPKTSPNEVVTLSCPEQFGRGVMHYKCLSGGSWDPNGPETDQCIPYTTTTTTTTSTTPTTTTTMTTTDVNKAMAEHLSPKMMDLLHNLARPGSKHNLSTLLPSLTENATREIENIKDPKLKKAMADRFKETILGISDDLLKDGNAWSNMSVSQQRSTAASLLKSVEATGLLAASTMEIGAANTTRKSNVVMKLMNVNLALNEPARLENKPQAGSLSKVNHFTIPIDVLRQVTNGFQASVPVVFVVMSNMSEWLTPEPTSGSIDTNVIDARPRREPVRRLVNSDIVSASISKHSLKNLAEPVLFLMEHRQMEAVANPKCSFWDTEKGGWSSEGCEVFESNKTHTICKCNHLTSFAVLMDITGASLLLPSDVRFSLELMTYIGCTISIICLMLSWVTFACFKSLDCDRNTIHKHLVFCLMVAQLLLVIGIQQTNPPVLCSVIAGVLHFFFLASFAWMCLEGVQLYVMLIEVFESERSRVLWYYLFGYGVPTVIVTVSAAVFPAGYGTEFHCWLSTERGFIWSFVGPALAVMLVNIVMLCIAISIMVRHSNMSHTMRQKSVPQKMRTWIKGAVVLVVLLGLTWLFGVLYLENLYHTIIFSYLFTILNTLQGLFIFVFHCLLNDKVQKEYRRLVRHSEWLPDCVRVRYGGASSSGSKEHSSSGNVMSRFLRGKKKNNAGGESSNNSAKPFLNKEPRRFSSSVPSSSDGATSSHLSSDTSNNNHRKTSRSSTFRSNGADPRFLKPMEVNGIAGDLSEVIDCSIVDSEFVSEYCQKNMQVSAEVKRYSTASEDSGRGEGGREGEEQGGSCSEDLDRLAALSVGSLSKHQPYVVSNSDFGDNKSEGWADSDNVDGDEEEDDDEEDEAGNAATLVNPARCRMRGNPHDHHADDSEEDDDDDDDDEGLVDGDDIRQGLTLTLLENQPLMMKQTDSERVLINNAVNKPREMTPPNASPRQSPSLTDVGFPGRNGEGEAGSPSQPSHTSVPCLKFKSGVTNPPMSTAEESEKDTVMNSLPNLNRTHCNGAAKVNGQSPSVKRHSSDGHMYFSPFRFSASEC
ncbi:latrophilin-like protein 1 isoform X2 [Littorina saxatilis]|uniref:Latrophilin Cirl n=1 Tax=Littorina saxatilis TaxID=31220 RepID=A0AAN9G9F5_9CAEN